MTNHPAGMPRYPGAEGSASTSSADEPSGETELVNQLFQGWVRVVAWFVFGIFCFVFFTVSKLPRDRINDVIEGNISSALASRGITFTAKKAHLSLLFGISYDLKDVTLSFPPPEPQAHIDEIEISPSFLPLLLGKYGGSVKIRNGKGSFQLSGSVKANRFSMTFNSKNFDIGSIALLKLLSNIGGGAIVSGHGTLSADLNAMTETNADIQVSLSKIIIDSQSIQGFAIPRLTISDGKLDFSVDHGRGLLKELRLGKPDSPSDDIKADVTGDILFGKKLETSTCNLKADFSFSPALLKSFSIVGMLLAPGKQPDGSFSYKLAGPLLAPNPTPAGGR